MRVVAIIAMLGAATLAACGPVPLAEAERSCLSRARDARAPRGEAAIGVGNSGNGFGAVSRVELSISSDYIMGRDPAQVYATCVQKRSGQLPSRPLYDMPGWRG